VTDRDAWRRLGDRLAADLAAGRIVGIDVLVNNAGVCAAAETLGSDGDTWRRMMDVNFFGVLNGCQAVGPLMDRGARIINVASIAGYLAGPAMGAYSASKAAVIALSEAMYAELRPRGIGVTVVAPGFFRTGLLETGAFCTPRHRAEAERLSRRAKFTADDVARIALTAAGRRQLYAVMGGRVRWLWRFKRLAPRMVQRIVSRRYHRTFGIES
jgi:NAD(P)-dependent dehydrogenase (short-subunit alcohol dehydrogenase family)